VIASFAVASAASQRLDGEADRKQRWRAREAKLRLDGAVAPGRGWGPQLVNTSLSEHELWPPNGREPVGPARAHPVKPKKPGDFPAPEGAPGHVKACHWADPHTGWSVWTWKKNDPSQVTRRPYTCGSWRHPGPCARHSASMTFARIREAVQRPEYDAKGWVFLVLTLDRLGTFSGKTPWLNQSAAYKDLSRLSRNLHTKLRRAETFEAPCDAWAAVVECHRSGWPHVNELIYAPELAQKLREDYADGRKLGLTHREATLVRGELADCLTSTGWGVQSTAEAVESVDAVNGYITKLAAAGEATCGELAKLCQVPMNAPPRFRRLRAAKNWLPKKRKDESITGTLIRNEPAVARSEGGAITLAAIANPRDAEIAAFCCRREGDRMEEIRAVRPLVKTFGRENVEPGPIAVYPLTAVKGAGPPFFARQNGTKLPGIS